MSQFAKLERLIEQARGLGFEIRYENLNGGGGGICEFGGKRWLFIDLAVSAEESWEHLQHALRVAIDPLPSQSQLLERKEPLSTFARKAG